MSEKKLCFYTGHLIKMSTVNKVRIALTSIGIFVAVFLFSSGIIISASYYSGTKRVIEEMDEHAVVVSSAKDPAAVRDELSCITSVVPAEDGLLSDKKPILSTKISSDSYLTVLARVHGVTGTNGIRSVVDDNGQVLPIDMELVEGRFISPKDSTEIAEVAVIDELTAQLLFPNESAIGKTVDLNVGVCGSVSISMEEERTNSCARIVGVVKNSRVDEARKLLLKKALQNDTESNRIVEVSLYCPISTLKKWFPDQESTRYFIYRFNDDSPRDSFVETIGVLNDINQRKGLYNEYTVIVKKQLVAEIDREQRYTKQLLNIIVVILCVISGLSIMSVTFFSIKERIPEIGIRKAFGASRLDILFQFIFEMVSIAFIVSVFAVCLSFYACKLAEWYLLSNLFILLDVTVSVYQVALPVLVGTLEAFLCSILPSLYAASIKTTDALRFE